MESRKSTGTGALTALDGAMALIVLLLMVQIWLLSATLDAFLAGNRDAALPELSFPACFFLPALLSTALFPIWTAELHKTDIQLI